MRNPKKKYIYRLHISDNVEKESWSTRMQTLIGDGHVTRWINVWMALVHLRQASSEEDDGTNATHTHTVHTMYFYK